MIVEYEPAAVEELSAAVGYYLEISPELATRLIDELDRAVQRIVQIPHAWPPIERTRGCRRCLLTRFPFQVVYRLEGEKIRVYAFAHQKRKPGYWRKRLRQSRQQARPE